MSMALLLSPKRSRIAAVIALAGAALLASPPARAEDEVTRARQAFAEGRALEGKNQWADALEKFKVVAAFKMTPQVRFHLALCEENTGKLVSALKGFELAIEEAKQAGAAAIEVATNAPPRVEALRQRVARITITVSGKQISSKVYLDDVAVSSKDLGGEIMVDPGAHVIEVRDDSGKPTSKKELTLAEKASEKVELQIDDKDTTEAPKPEQPVAPPPSRMPAYVTGGVGLAALAVSGVFFGLRAANVAAITSHCQDQTNLKGCRPSDQDLASTGKVYTGVADGLLGVGAAAVGTAAVLFVVLGPKKQPAAQTQAQQPAVSVRLVPTGTGVMVLGKF